MHVLDKIFSERNEKQNAENTAKQRAKEHFKEIDCDLRMILFQNVESRKREYGTGHDHTGTGSDRLYDHILTESIFLVTRTRQSYGNN